MPYMVQFICNSTKARLKREGEKLLQTTAVASVNFKHQTSNISLRPKLFALRSMLQVYTSNQINAITINSNSRLLR